MGYISVLGEVTLSFDKVHDTQIGNSTGDSWLRQDVLANSVNVQTHNTTETFKTQGVVSSQRTLTMDRSHFHNPVRLNFIVVII